MNCNIPLCVQHKWKYTKCVVRTEIYYISNLSGNIQNVLQKTGTRVPTRIEVHHVFHMN